MLKDFFTPQFIRFLLSGGFAAVVNFITGHWLADVLPLNLDYVAGQLAGMFVAFVLFERLVFGQSDHGRQKSIAAFIVINGLAILQTYIIGVFLEVYFFPSIGWTWFAEEIARAIAIMVPVLTSFIGHKYFTFKQALN